MKKAWSALRAPLVGIVLSMLVGTAVLIVVGERPGVLAEAFYNVCFTDFGLGYTLFYMTPLLLTGLSVAVCFRCGLFNIGAEGQLYIGAIAVVLGSRLMPNAPIWIGVPFGILCAGLAGAFWGAIAGFLKAKRGSHEVIVTILLNFIAIYLVNYLILYPLGNHDGENVNPESLPVGPGYQIASLNRIFSVLGISVFASTPVNAALFLALGAAFFCYYFLFFTSRGYSLRAVGQNPVASRFAGISVSSQTMIALGLGGAFAGLVGVNEVMGYQHKVLDGFSPAYGFTGIAVALLARNHPLGIIFSAFLFGALHNSSRELEFLSDRVTKELSFVLQGTLIAFVAARSLLETWLQKPAGRRFPKIWGSRKAVKA